MNLMKRFFFKGCWECGKEGHSRHECPEWLRILDPSGKAPPGHQGAKDKALAKWKANKKSAIGKAKSSGTISSVEEKELLDWLERDAIMSIVSVDTESEDDDSDSSSRFPHKVFALNEPKPVERSNRYAMLEDPADHRDEIKDSAQNEESKDPVLALMHSFAHQVQIGKRQTQKQRRAKEREDKIVFDEAAKYNAQHPGPSSIVIEKESDFDQPQIRQFIKALPRDHRGNIVKNAIAELAKLCPTEDEVPLEEGEFWVMANTGSTKNCLKVMRDCPQFARFVRETAASRRGKGEESAF